MFNLAVRLVPVTPTTCRMFAATEVTGFQGTMVAKILGLRRRFDMHLERNAVIDGDGIFLHKISQDALVGVSHWIVHKLSLAPVARAHANNASPTDRAFSCFLHDSCLINSWCC